jgi:predicted permease
MLDVLFDVVLPVLLVAAVGGYVGKRLGFSTETMSKAVFNLFSPCLVFTSIAAVQLHAGDVGRLVAVVAVVFAVNAAVAWAWSDAHHTNRSTRACNVLSAAVVNQGNMGLPMAKLAFGDTGLQIAVLIWVAGVVLWSSFGIALGALARGGHSSRRALLAPLRYPSIYAAALGAIVNASHIDLPAFIRESTSTLGQASIPCMLVALGLQFRMPRLTALADPLATSLNRLIIGPLVAWPVGAAAGLTGVGLDTSIMLAGMPSAVMTTILAVELDADPELAVRTVIITTLLSIPTLTVLITLLQ